MKERLELFLSSVLTAAIGLLAVAFAHREFFARPASQASVPPPTFVARWQEIVEKGVVIGDSNAPIKIVVFSDLQCPNCRREHHELKRVRARLGNQVSLVFVHYPLSYHRYAYPAARAAECARKYGSIEGFLDAIYQKQDSLGL